MELITIRNSSCGKVMLSQVCVKNSVHGGVHGEGGHTWQKVGVCGKGGVHGTGVCVAKAGMRRPLQRTVRILLECILVNVNNNIYF